VLGMFYSNIFNYYRGQTKKDNSIDYHSKQVENNVKKALINVLEHSNPLLTLNFIRKFINQDINGEKFNYLYEVTRPLSKPTPKAYVLGIAETKEVIRTNENKENTRPDGAIYTEDTFSILIETKTGVDQLYTAQLKGHEEMFAEGQVVEENPIIITWGEIRRFFNEQYVYFKNKEDKVTCFLLEQFDQFCNYNSIGISRKSKEYYFSLFKTPKAQQLAREIDNYLLNESEYKDDVEDSHEAKGQERTDCIGYKSTKSPFKFATITEKRNVCFVLHLGKKLHTQKAKDMQKEIDDLLKHKYIETDSSRLTDGEVYIRLEWVDSLEQIKPFIDEAYYLRLKK
jgi:hypothetical protein